MATWLGSAPQPRSRLWLLAGLALAWTAVVALAAWWVLNLRLQAERQQTLTRAEARINAVKNVLNVALQDTAALAAYLARQPAAREFLRYEVPAIPAASPGDRAGAAALEAYAAQPPVQAMSRWLDLARRDFGLPLVALNDAEGRTTAISVSAQGPLAPFYAINLKERRYFIDALARGLSMQFVTGRVSLVPGLFFAHRVEHEGRALGAIVIKIEADRLNRLLADLGNIDSYVADDLGVMILGSRPQVLFRRLPAAEARAKDLRMARYQQEPEPLDWRWSTVRVGSQLVTTAELDGRRHLAVRSAMDGRPFEVWAMASLADESVLVGNTLAGAFGLWLAGGVLLWAGWRRFQWLQSTLQARREMYELTSALPLTVFRYIQPPLGKGYFAFVGRGVEDLLGTGAGALVHDPELPWRLAGSAAQRPPVQPLEFAIERAGATRPRAQHPHHRGRRHDGVQRLLARHLRSPRDRGAVRGRLRTRAERLPVLRPPARHHALQPRRAGAVRRQPCRADSGPHRLVPAAVARTAGGRPAQPRPRAGAHAPPPRQRPAGANHRVALPPLRRA
jgi:hypothetical protein